MANDTTPPGCPDSDLSLQPVLPDLTPGPQYAVGQRPFQGIPGLERTAGGSLLATWYAGGETEGPDNYVTLARSTDNGQSWQDPIMIIDPPGLVRAFDPCLWRDPLDRLWLFWAQAAQWWDGRAGVWAIRCDQPDADELSWTPPRRLAEGIMMNKPTVTAAGEWLLPTAVWNSHQPFREDMAAHRFSNVTVSTDNGESFTHRGSADVPERSCDEHMLVELRDGRLWMLVRTKYGIGQSFSSDGGRTWSAGQDSGLGGPNSRFFIRRLESGRLLLVNHVDFTARNNLTAMLSDDDGQSWYGSLRLDERSGVSYPDGFQAPDGRIFVTYDRNRKTDREILLAVFTEEDVTVGRLASAGARLEGIISRAADG